MSKERIRVASRLWCPSRIVVSVTSSRSCASIQSATAFGPFSSSSCRVPGGGASSGTTGGLGARASAGGLGRPAVSGMAVDGDVGDVGQDLRRPVAARAEMEELGRRVDELGGVGIVEERRVLQQVLDEGDVGRDPADAELAQRPVQPRDRHLRRRRPGRHLLEQRVVVAGDHRPRIGGAAVEPDAVPGRAAIGGDPAVVGDEVVLRVLGGDPALDRVAVERDSSWLALPVASASVAPSAIRICARTMSMPVTSSVTVCSTWMRGLTSMK